MAQRKVSGATMLTLAVAMGLIILGSSILNRSDQSKTTPAPQESPTPKLSFVSPTESAEAEPSPKANSPTTSPSLTPTISGSPLPSGFPNNVPLPNKGTVTGSYGSTVEGRQSYVVALTVVGDASTVGSTYRNQLKEADFTIDEVPGPAGEAFFGASRGSVSLTISVSQDQKDPSLVLVTINALVD